VVLLIERYFDAEIIFILKKANGDFFQEEDMKHIGLMAVMIVSLLGCAPAQYSAEELSQRNAQHIEGVITEQSRGSFVLKDTEGEEKIFRTGELTQYMPPVYRSLEGDTVRVTYQEVWENSGKAKRAVLQLAPIVIPDKNKPLPNPIQGEIVGLGKGSSRHSKSLLVKVPGEQDAILIYIPFGNTEVNSLLTDNLVWGGAGFLGH
jgi:hypothetical protein